MSNLIYQIDGGISLSFPDEMSANTHDDLPPVLRAVIVAKFRAIADLLEAQA